MSSSVDLTSCCDWSVKTDMMILNREPICKGIWTRQERNQKSTIDYILIENSNARAAQSMNIYDDGRNSTTSDHNWMDLTIKTVDKPKGKTKKVSPLVEKKVVHFGKDKLV